MPVADVHVNPPSAENNTPAFEVPEAMHFDPSSGLKLISCIDEVGFLLVHETPPSALRQTPVPVAARMTWLFDGLIANRFTKLKLEFAVAPSCGQVAPASRVVETPGARIA